MAKAKAIIGLDCRADAPAAMAEVLRARFGEVAEARPGALDFSDIEGVHQMRVAIRRLRSALRDFAPVMHKPLPRRLKHELKRLADRLGAVRDHDVALVALDALQAEAETEAIKAGVGRLIVERSRLRDIARTDLIEALAAGNFSDLQTRFTTAIGKAAARRKSKRTVSFSEAGREVVAAGLRDLLDLGASLYEPFDIEELHEMRIAAKRLRYAVELFTHCWGASVAPFAAEVAEMQSFLGEVHDCDVWIESMGSRLQSDEANTHDYEVAVWLLSEFVKKRTKEYRSALKLWSRWQSDDFAGRMRAAIRA